MRIRGFLIIIQGSSWVVAIVLGTNLQYNFDYNLANVL